MKRNIRIGFSLTVLLLVNLFTYYPAAAPKFSNWAAPVNLGPVVNSAYADNGPAISKDRLSLYFTSTRPGGFGDQDIWVSQRASLNDPWGPPTNLGPMINTSYIDGIPAF